MSSPALPPDAVPPDAVRDVQFTLIRRGGYDPEEVDEFIGQVALTIEHLSRHGGDGGSSPEPRSDAAPRLHDPEGAAQRLLAAAQQTSDTLTAEARGYAERVTREADEYATATRSEADEHASTVTVAAESQAATIRTVATEEARRVAEEARSALVAEVDGLQEARSALQDDCTRLEEHLKSEQGRMLAILEAMREAVETRDLGLTPTPEVSEVELPEPSAAVLAAASDKASGADEVADAVADASTVEAVAVQEADENATLSDTDDDVTDVTDDGDDNASEVGADETPATDEGQVADDVADREEAVEAVAEEADADPSASIFALDDEGIGDTGSMNAWLDEVAEEPTADDTSGSSIFDIEADPDWEDGGPPTQAMPVIGDGDGASFFDELRDGDSDGLGPLDDETDAAMSAFFEADSEAEDENWRAKFSR